jgi:hypothetical protein
MRWVHREAGISDILVGFGYRGGTGVVDFGPWDPDPGPSRRAVPLRYPGEGGRRRLTHAQFCESIRLVTMFTATEMRTNRGSPPP